MEKDRNSNLLNRLHEIIRIKGLDPKSLSKASGLHEKTMRNILAGSSSLKWDALANLATNLELNPTWLLTGEGEPEMVLEAADGRLAGDLLHEIVLGRIAGNEEEAARRMDMEAEKLRTCLGLRFAGDWATLRKLAAAGVNINFLLLGEGQDYFPRAPIRRAMLAIGAKDAYALAKALDAEVKEVERFLAEPDDDPLVIPWAWAEALEKKYGLCMRWVNDLTYPSHIPIKDVAREIPGSDPISPTQGFLTQAMEAAVRLLREAHASDETVQKAILTMIRLTNPRYPEAQMEAAKSGYGEAAEGTAPSPDKRSAG